MTSCKVRDNCSPFQMMMNIVLGQIPCVGMRQKKHFFFLFELKEKKYIYLESLQNLRIIEVTLAEIDWFACPYWGNSIPMMQAIFHNDNYCFIFLSASTFLSVYHYIKYDVVMVKCRLWFDLTTQAVKVRMIQT